jgi:hypothetical protein
MPSREKLLPLNILLATGNIYTWTGKKFVEIIFLLNEVFKLNSIVGKWISPVCWSSLTLILLTWRIWWAPNNASKWQMGFNSAFKWLIWEFLCWNIYDTSYVLPTGTKGRFCQHPVSLTQATKLSAPFWSWWYVGVSVSQMQRPSDQRNYPKHRICVPKLYGQRVQCLLI